VGGGIGWKVERWRDWGDGAEGEGMGHLALVGSLGEKKSRRKGVSIAPQEKGMGREEDIGVQFIGSARMQEESERRGGGGDFRR